jgi:hypothetical protein
MAASTTGKKWYKNHHAVSALYSIVASHGILRKLSPEPPSSSVAATIPVLATPSQYPLDQFTLAGDLQPAFNTLVDAVSRHQDFLTGALENVLKTDSFTRKLFDIYEQTRHDNKQSCVCM